MKAELSKLAVLYYRSDVTLRDKPNILDKFVLYPDVTLHELFYPPLGVVENMCSENKYEVQTTVLYHRFFGFSYFSPRYNI